jgi:alpha-tubulin suppressor-like RCC1 family protein
MHDLARASLLGSVVAAALLAPVACWNVAPDSAKDIFLEGGVVESTLIETILVTADGETDGGASSEGGGSVDADAEAAAPLVIAPTASPLLASGAGFACRIDPAGAVWCWGDNAFGQAGSTPGSATVTTAQRVQGVPNAVSLALGDFHACAVTTGHAVYCWGLNDAFQLGHPAATDGDQICLGAAPGETVPCSSTPSLVANLRDAVAIAAAGAWTCILATDGSAQCWGGMQAAVTDAGVACGVGAQASGGSCYPAPYTVGGVSGATQLAVGFDHACVVGAAGSQTDAGNQVSCWGNNDEGQVSPLACSQSNCTSPIARSDLPTTTSLATGNRFSCALASDGTVRCFGDNTYGQLGHTAGSAGDQGAPGPDGGFGVFNPTPTQASATALVSLVGGGNESSCAILESGSVECWGDVTAGGSATAVVVTGLPPSIALGTFDGAYVCALAAADGTPWCWTLGSASAPTSIQTAADGG